MNHHPITIQSLMDDRRSELLKEGLRSQAVHRVKAETVRNANQVGQVKHSFTKIQSTFKDHLIDLARAILSSCL